MKSWLVRCALLVWLAGCAEVQPTQMLVRVEASPSVAAKLKYIRGFLYPAAETDESKWDEDVQFPVAGVPVALEGGTVLLGSFGVAQGPADRFMLVIKGYESSEPSARPVIEQKGFASFREDRKVVVRLSLLDPCYRPEFLCSGLSLTCSAATGGNCAPVPELASVDIEDEVAPGGNVGAADGGVSGSPSNGGGGTKDAGTADASGGASAGASSSAIVGLAAGYSHTCAWREDGAAQCWGDNDRGEVGDGTTTARLTPALVSGLRNVVELSAGFMYTCARLSTAEVKCWGSNLNGELGDGTNTNKLLPTSVSGLSNAVQISAGGSHACARLVTGEVKCWGDNSLGQLGDGTMTPRLVPTPVTGLDNALEVSAGNTHTCARLRTGEVKCWGAVGVDSDGPIANRVVPTLVSGVREAVELGTGNLDTCARTASNDVKCWRGTRQQPSQTPEPPTLIGAGQAAGLALGFDHFCVLMAAGGQVKCLGGNQFGEVGDGTTTLQVLPTFVAGLSGAVEISAGRHHTCARLRSNEVKCWGDNASGQLGTGSTARLSTPTTAVVFP